MQKLKPLNKAVAAVLLGGGAAGIFFGAEALQSGRVFGQDKATQAQVSQAEDLATVFRDVGKRVGGSVVNIEVHKTIKAPQSVPLPDDMLRKFFPNGVPQQPDGGDGGGDEAPEGAAPGGNYEQVGTGSGVIMEVSGNTAYILTNNHVAGGATEMTVTLADGRKVSNAKLVGADPKSDLAVVKIESEDLKAAKWGDSSTLQQGDWIIAFGSPFNYIGSMTHGIVSALNRSQVGILGNQGYEDFIQVDAPINPGNSGGPLVNLHGDVVGINTAIASRSGGFQGIGFAIPINEAKWVYGQLKDHGKVTRGWLGVGIADVTAYPDVAKAIGYDQNTGVVVQQLQPESPAQGHLKVYDVITSVNDKPVRTVTELRNRIAEETPGSELKLTVFRDGKEIPLTLKLGTQPDDLTLGSRRQAPQQDGATPSRGEALGMRLSTPDDQMIQRFGLPDGTKGAVVTAVTPKSPADRAHLMLGDVITQVDRHPVASSQEATTQINAHTGKNPILLYVESGAAGGHIVAISPKR